MQAGVTRRSSAACRSSTPAGFERYTRAGGFAAVLGPLWFGADPAITFAVKASRRCCNGQGIVHGGYISTFVDIALVHGAALAADSQAMFVTASLSLDFLALCRHDEWLFCRPEILRMGARTGVVVTRVWTERAQVAFARASIVRVAAQDRS